MPLSLSRIDRCGKRVRTSECWTCVRAARLAIVSSFVRCKHYLRQWPTLRRYCLILIVTYRAALGPERSRRQTRVAQRVLFLRCMTNLLFLSFLRRAIITANNATVALAGEKMTAKGIRSAEGERKKKYKKRRQGSLFLSLSYRDRLFSLPSDSRLPPPSVQMFLSIFLRRHTIVSPQ